MASKHLYTLDAVGNSSPIVDSSAMRKGETAEYALDSGKFGGKLPSEYVTKDLLWENASPSSEFVAHRGDDKIITNDSYNEYEIWFQYYHTGNKFICVKVKRYGTQAAYNIARAELALRNVASVEGGFEFSEGMLCEFNATSYETNNTILIPIKIYGIN